MEVVVPTGAINHAKLQSNRHHQQTNTHLFFRPDTLPVTQPTVSKHCACKLLIRRWEIYMELSMFMFTQVLDSMPWGVPLQCWSCWPADQQPACTDAAVRCSSGTQHGERHELSSRCLCNAAGSAFLYRHRPAHCPCSRGQPYCIMHIKLCMHVVYVTFIWCFMLLVGCQEGLLLYLIWFS